MEGQGHQPVRSKINKVFENKSSRSGVHLGFQGLCLFDKGLGGKRGISGAKERRACRQKGRCDKEVET